MKKNNDKYWRIGIFAFAFLLGLVASLKTGSGMIALFSCILIPLLYIPYGISDWYRKKPSEPSEKQSEPKKSVVPEIPLEEGSVEEEKNSELPQDHSVLSTDEKKVPRYAAETVRGDGNILESVRKTDQLEYPFRKVEYRQNISFEDEGKVWIYRNYRKLSK